MQPSVATARQIEAARRAITRHMKRQGRLWIRVFPDVAGVDEELLEVRRVPGKGAQRILGGNDFIPRSILSNSTACRRTWHRGFRTGASQAADQDAGLSARIEEEV